MSENAAAAGPDLLVGPDGLPSFVPLTARSHYSLGQAAATVSELVARAKAIGAISLGLMDEASLSGALEFATESRKYGIKPVVGLRVPVLIEDRGGRQITGSLGLIVLNQAGWSNLCQITAALNAQPSMRLRPSEIMAFTDGVACLTGQGMDGVLGELIEAKAEESLAAFKAWLLQQFPGRAYIEMCRPQPASLDHALLATAQDWGLPLLASTDIRYAMPPKPGQTNAEEGRNGHIAWLVTRAIHQERLVSDTEMDATPRGSEAAHVRDSAEMKALFADLPEALAETGRLTARANFAPDKAKPSLPVWRPQGSDGSLPEDARAASNASLREQTFAGLEGIFERSAIPEPERATYVERLEYELSVIGRMGFSDYFLIVADFIGHAYKTGIPVGPGRGSGAGSLVAYTLGITRLDPIVHGLLFERFLNPERVSMPDFDIDFCEERRSEILDYIRGRYPPENVAPIVTFGETRARSALNDAARVVVNAKGQVLTRSKLEAVRALLPNDKMPLAKEGLRKQIIETPDLLNLVRQDPLLTRVIRAAVAIEGLYSQAGIHASGLIIAAQPVASTMPMLQAKTNKADTATKLVCGYDMKWAEAGGAVKFDILGLTALTTIDRAAQRIKQYEPAFDPEAIPFDDPETMRAFAEGRTGGSFQFEGDGMRGALRDIGPTRFSDLAAANALYRPGPMKFIKQYANRKQGLEKFQYPGDPEKTKSFLEETYGFMVFQEQVMMMARVMAGYSLAGADLLRRAMGKKIKAEMEVQRKVFIEGDAQQGVPGAVALGIPAAKATQLFDDISAFADYGFNKPHAVAYALLGYRTLWLKTHHPAAFLAALMTDEVKDRKKGLPKIQALRRDCESMGLALLMPDINRSSYEFTAEVSGRALDDQAGHQPDALRFGLAIVSHMSKLPDAFLKARAEAPFASVADFVRRVEAKAFNKKQIEGLVQAGAFDSLDPNRRRVLEEIAWRRKTIAIAGDGADPSLPPEVRDLPPWDPYLVTRNEFAACGIYLAHHPIDLEIQFLSRAGVREIEKIKEWAEARRRSGGYVPNLSGIRVVAMVDGVFMRKMKGGGDFLNVQMSSRSEAWNAQFFMDRSQSFGRGDEKPAPAGGGSGQEEVKTATQRDVMLSIREVLERAQANNTPVVIKCNLDPASTRMTIYQAALATEIRDSICAQDDFVIQIPMMFGDGAARLAEVQKVSAALEPRRLAPGEAGMTPVIRAYQKDENGNPTEVDVILPFQIKPDWTDQTLQRFGTITIEPNDDPAKVTPSAPASLPPDAPEPDAKRTEDQAYDEIAAAMPGARWRRGQATADVAVATPAQPAPSVRPSTTPAVAPPAEAPPVVAAPGPIRRSLFAGRWAAPAAVASPAPSLPAATPPGRQPLFRAFNRPAP